ncbi:MAG: hypothetical protein V4489_10490 [Chlamydiota bacterium]
MALPPAFDDISRFLAENGYPSDNTLEGDAKVQDLFKKMSLVMHSSTNTTTLQKCTDLLASVQKEPLSKKMKTVIDRVLLSEGLGNSIGLITLTKEEASRFKGNAFMGRFNFESASAQMDGIEPEPLYISIPETCEMLGIEGDTQFHEAIIKEIFESIKEDRPPNFTPYFTNVAPGDYSAAVGILFGIVDGLNLQDFQMQYLEPFRKVFPKVPFSEIPNTIMSLDLPRAHLHMEKRKDLSDFTRLKTLHGFAKELLKSLPMDSKESIEELEFAFSDEVEVNLSEFSSLKKLKFFMGYKYTAQVINNIPSEVKQQIKELELSSEALTEIDLAGFTSLKTLALKNTKNVAAFLNNLPPEVKQSIEELDLSSLDLKGIDLSGFTGLQKLKLYDHQEGAPELIKSIPPEIAPNIKELILSQLDVDEINLSDFDGLKKLDLSSAGGFVVRLINRLSLKARPKIEELSLKNADVWKIDLLDFTGLKKLNLFGSQGKISAFIEELPLETKQGIEELILGGLSNVTGVNLSDFTSLKNLRLSDITNGIANILQSLPLKTKKEIREIDLSSSNIIGVTLPDFTGLKVLDVRYVKRNGQDAPEKAVNEVIKTLPVNIIYIKR